MGNPLASAEDLKALWEVTAGPWPGFAPLRADRIIAAFGAERRHRMLHFAHATAAAGIAIHEATRAVALEQTGGRWQVSTEAGKLVADRIILATDAYTDRLWPHVTQSLVNVTSAQLATGPLPAALLAQILPARAGVSETRKIALACPRNHCFRHLGCRASGAPDPACHLVR